MIHHGEVNPLNVLNAREVTTLPPHFDTVILPDMNAGSDAGSRYRHYHRVWGREDRILDWIYKNTCGRFYVKSHTVGRKRSIVVAFEIYAELSYFNLACPEVVN